MIVEILKSKSKKQKYRVVLKFENGLIFMHSERYYNKSHAKKMAQKLWDERLILKELDE
jgi:uncharacterized protein YegP (UPF0339 family)